MVVDPKHWTKGVAVPAVEAGGFVDDVAAELGLMVTSSSFSEAGRRRVAHMRGVRWTSSRSRNSASGNPRYSSTAITADATSHALSRRYRTGSRPSAFARATAVR
jgi:hypothetical protein